MIFHLPGSRSVCWLFLVFLGFPYFLFFLVLLGFSGFSWTFCCSPFSSSLFFIWYFRFSFTFLSFFGISWLESQYRHSQSQLQHWPSWRSILEKLILRITPTTGQYGKILPNRLSNTGEVNVNIIVFCDWDWAVINLYQVNVGSIKKASVMKKTFQRLKYYIFVISNPSPIFGYQAIWDSWSNQIWQHPRISIIFKVSE